MLVTALTLSLTATTLEVVYHNQPVQAEVINNAQQTIHITKKQKDAINKDFLQWAAQRATLGKLAVSNYYFDHGPGTDGCLWYAKTPNGDILVRNASDEYSSKNYRIKAIGGVVFYTDANGNIGQCDDIAEETDDGLNYSDDEIDIDKPVDKYLLADNGIVYECKLDGATASPDSGFAIKGMNSDDAERWIISNDQNAQTEYRSLLNKYTGNTVDTPINYTNTNVQNNSSNEDDN